MGINRDTRARTAVSCLSPSRVIFRCISKIGCRLSRRFGVAVSPVTKRAFHALTTQVPHAVDLAIPRGTEKPRIDYPPVNIYWLSSDACSSGIETPAIGPTMGGRQIRVYGPEKSKADAFKYRNKIGIEVALEALRTWRSRRRSKIEQLIEYARVCRVERIMRPYLEAMA